MRRYLYLASPLMVLASVGYALAQTLTEVVETPSTTLGEYAWKMFLTALTLGGSAVTPYLTKYLTMWVLIGIGKTKANVPAPVLIFLSTVISGVFAGVMGTTTDLPLHGDSAVLGGSLVGAAAQKLANSAPIVPTPEAIAKIIEKQPTAAV